MGTLSLSDYEDVHISVPWGHIAGRWYGNRSERPILAIHGWMDNLGSFDTLIPLLPDYLGVLCIEIPGHGRSTSMPPGMTNSTPSWTLVISRVMKEYKWSKVSLMGHSLGGVLSFIHTSLAPHTVDLVITLDIVLPYLESPEGLMFMAEFLEKHLLEEIRAEEVSINEPPSFTVDQACSIVSRGTNDSVPPEFAHHLVYRSVAKSQLYPDKLYFTRDRRIRYYSHHGFNSEIAAELASRIRDMPYLIIKGTESFSINNDSDEVISILKTQNPHFEYHEVPGAHHVHLLNAEKCAQYIVPFLRRHRPPPVSRWSIAGEEQNLRKRKTRKALESQKRVGKL